MGFSANQNARRILALWLPRLPTDRLQRRRDFDAADELPLVVAAKHDNALRISAVDRNAARLNLVPGMPLADARAMVPRMRVSEADAPADLRLLERIADWCDRYTPFVALDPPYGLLLEITGVTHLFGGERAMLDCICVAIAKQGFTVKAAIAGNSHAARALAHFAHGTIAPPGQEAQTIATLPVEALNLAPQTAHGLRRAGLKTIGQLASRTRTELTSRFGKDMIAILDHAWGRAAQPISPRRPLPDYLAEHRFLDPATTEAVIASSLLSLAKSLAGILEARGKGARLLEASFFRADGEVRRIAIETGKPMRDPAILERLFRERLDALADPLDAGFGFDLIRLEARHVEPYDSSAPRFDDFSNGEEEIAQLIDRLAARFGRNRVLCFSPQDTHIPEAEAVAIPAQYKRASKISWRKIRGPAEAPRRPLRLFAKPELIDVVAEVPDGPPLRFRWRRALHSVAHAEGPERIAMEWWRHQTIQPTRDYYRVEDGEGRRFWLYRDGLYGRETDRPHWYVHGLFA